MRLKTDVSDVTHAFLPLSHGHGLSLFLSPGDVSALFIQDEPDSVKTSPGSHGTWSKYIGSFLFRLNVVVSSRRVDLISGLSI